MMFYSILLHLFTSFSELLEIFFRIWFGLKRALKFNVEREMFGMAEMSRMTESSANVELCHNIKFNGVQFEIENIDVFLDPFLCLRLRDWNGSQLDLKML